jgi:signal transduction histidine kinase
MTMQTTSQSSGVNAPLLTRFLAPLTSADTYRGLFFLFTQLVLGIVAWVLIPLGLGLVLLFCITPLVVPLLIGFRAVVGGLAQASGKLAGELLGVRVDPPVVARGEGGFWNRAKNVLADGTFWRQQAYLLVGWPVALVPLALLSFGLQLLSLPFWYHTVDSADMFGRDVDTLAEALLFAALGLVFLLATAYVVRPFAAVFRRLASSLLAGEGSVMSAAERRERRRRAFNILASVTGFVDLLLIAIWLLAGAGYFWPVWAILPITLVLAIYGWVVFVLERPAIIQQRAAGSPALAIHAGVSAAIWLFLVAIWALSGGGYFWPFWPLLALGFLVAVHGAIASHGRGQRIQELETTRAGAVDVQEAELRRIERDLHDGAQARLVALGMNLGLAEQKLRTDPEAVRLLLAEARQGATEALEELRDLARGIHPPILTDRGLEAAVADLVARSPVPVTLSVDLPERPPPAVEIAAYFVVSEALANGIKYAQATQLQVTIGRTREGLRIVVVDDGRGGANPAGNGLTGMRQRVEALDGRLVVASPEGGPTTVTAELP